MTEPIEQTLLPRSRMNGFLHHRIGRSGSDVWYLASEWFSGKDIRCNLQPVSLSNEGFYLRPEERFAAVNGYVYDRWFTGEQLGIITSAMAFAVCAPMDVDCRTAQSRLDEFIAQRPDHDDLTDAIKRALAERS